MKFRCVSCGDEHDISELSFGADAPAQWQLLTELERSHSELGQEQCVIDTTSETAFFLRACLQIPIIGTNCEFMSGFWVSLREKSFMQVSDYWSDPNRLALKPHFGWLSTAIPEYPDTMFLKASVRHRAPELRPLVELERTDHPLAIHQRAGIEVATLRSIVTHILHSDDAAS